MTFDMTYIVVFIMNIKNQNTFHETEIKYNRINRNVSARNGQSCRLQMAVLWVRRTPASRIFICIDWLYACMETGDVTLLH